MKILLYSGGMDSWLCAQLWKPDIKLYLDVKSRYSEFEKENLPSDVIVDSSLDFSKLERENAIIPHRNAYFVLAASQYAKEGELTEIALGALKGDLTTDKDETFAELSSNLLKHLCQPTWWNPEGTPTKVVLPFKHLTKIDLLRRYLADGGDIREALESTRSCYNPIDGKPCEVCKACVRYRVSFLEFGCEELWTEKFKNHLETLIPTLGKRGLEDEQTLAVWQRYKNKEVR